MTEFSDFEYHVTQVKWASEILWIYLHQIKLIFMEVKDEKALNISELSI